MTGIVHLGPRLSVNCSPLFPIVPLCPPLQNPNPFSDFPEPNVHLIKARLNPLPSIQNRYALSLYLFIKGINYSWTVYCIIDMYKTNLDPTLKKPALESTDKRARSVLA